jgi:hypothetical protein
MTQYSDLKSALQPHQLWHEARLLLLPLFLLALLNVKTINLGKLALGFVGAAQVKVQTFAPLLSPL